MDQQSHQGASDLAKSPKPTVFQAALPVAVLLLLILYGLAVRPLLLSESQLPLEIIFIMATAFSVVQLFVLGFAWRQIEAAIVSRFAKAFPAFMILFCIGLVIGSWIVCGTIPMLVCWGLKSIDPRYLYVISFVIPIIFSTLTGTSWGSVGTIGLVLMGIARTLEADLGIVAGAVVGGAYFGDKLSPLSDTTNMAALGAGVDLYEHIRSMLWTTIPSALIALVVFWLVGGGIEGELGSDARMAAVVSGLESEFVFSLWLLLPPIFVIMGSLLRQPPVPVLVGSVVLAFALALFTQPFSISEIVTSLKSGFSVSMLEQYSNLDSEIQDIFSRLLDRGGLFDLIEPIVIAIMVFIFIGTLDCIDAMPTLVRFFLQPLRSQPTTVVACLATTAFSSAITSSQYAVSFIVGDAFSSRFDSLKIPRRVLSRSLEDTGTMLESVIPWHPSAVYMVATLGVPFADYWHWQVLSLANFGVAVLLAVTGIGCHYGATDSHVKASEPEKPE